MEDQMVVNQYTAKADISANIWYFSNVYIISLSKISESASAVKKQYRPTTR